MRACLLPSSPPAAPSPSPTSQSLQSGLHQPRARQDPLPEPRGTASVARGPGPLEAPVFGRLPHQPQGHFLSLPTRTHTPGPPSLPPRAKALRQHFLSTESDQRLARSRQGRRDTGVTTCIFSEQRARHEAGHLCGCPAGRVGEPGFEPGLLGPGLCSNHPAASPGFAF